MNDNKTANYHRNIFRPPILLQIAFKKDKSVFYSTKFFPTLFMQDNFTTKLRNTFLRNAII